MVGINRHQLSSCFLFPMPFSQDVQQLIQQGLLTTGSHNLNFSHQTHHIDQLLNAYAEILPQVKYWDLKGQLNQQLRCPPLKPIFKVR